jgi:uncharacterized protein with HEPN domain
VTKDPRVYLVHILEAGDRILRYTAGGPDRFRSETLIQDAVIRNFEVIGEASKRVPDSFRAAHAAIPWRSLSGFRDVLSHQYEGVSVERLWAAIETDLPHLLARIREALPPLDELERELSS